jgi:hypothetical protein
MMMKATFAKHKVVQAVAFEHANHQILFPGAFTTVMRLFLLSQLLRLLKCLCDACHNEKLDYHNTEAIFPRSLYFFSADCPEIEDDRRRPNMTVNGRELPTRRKQHS